MSVLLLAVTNFLVWTFLVFWAVHRRHTSRRVPDGVLIASMVAVLGACVGGLLAGLRFAGVISRETPELSAAALLAGMLSAGVYASIVVARSRR